MIRNKLWNAHFNSEEQACARMGQHASLTEGLSGYFDLRIALNGLKTADNAHDRKRIARGLERIRKIWRFDGPYYDLGSWELARLTETTADLIEKNWQDISKRDLLINQTDLMIKKTMEMISTYIKCLDKW